MNIVIIIQSWVQFSIFVTSSRMFNVLVIKIHLDLLTYGSTYVYMQLLSHQICGSVSIN